MYKTRLTRFDLCRNMLYYTGECIFADQQGKWATDGDLSRLLALLIINYALWALRMRTNLVIFYILYKKHLFTCLSLSLWTCWDIFRRSNKCQLF